MNRAEIARKGIEAKMIKKKKRKETIARLMAARLAKKNALANSEASTSKKNSDMSGDQGFVLKDLKDFVFKEVIGGDVARKTIFVLLEHTSDQKPAILICDKNPFVEDSEQILQWISATKLHHVATNDIYGNYEASLPMKFNGIKTTFIYPATPKHIDKYRRQEVYLILETPEDYKNITSVYIAEGKFDLNWVYNFIEKKAEVERIVLSDEHTKIGFVLGMDLKWDGKNVDNLYLQAVVHRRDLSSVRDLTACELPLLENIRKKCSEYVVKNYGLHPNQILMYFHYQPTYYHLHVHIVNSKYEAPGHGPTSLFIDTVINNLKIDGDYYKKATLPFFCKQNHPLYELFHKAGRV